MPLTKEKKKELVAPETETIIPGPNDGVGNPPTSPKVNAMGARAPHPKLVLFRQGYQRGWTEAASVRLMKLEAIEQGFKEGDPEWPEYPAPRIVKKNKENIVENAPCPGYINDRNAKGQSKYVFVYGCGYYKGWTDSQEHKSATAKKLVVAQRKSLRDLSSKIKKTGGAKKKVAKKAGSKKSARKRPT